MAAFSRPRFTVRTRIVATVVVLTLLTLVAAGFAAYLVERRQIDIRLEAQLANQVEEFRTLAEDAYNTGEFVSLDGLLESTFRHAVPAENEGMIGYVGTEPAWTQRGGLDMADDPELIAYLSERTGVAMETGDGEVTTIRTAKSEYMYALLPLSLGTLGEGSYVAAYDHDTELASLSETFRTYAVVCFICLILLTLVAWLILRNGLWTRRDDEFTPGNRRMDNAATVLTVGVGVGIMFVALLAAMFVLALIRELRETAASVGESDLSTRIDASGNDDLSELAHQFNNMLDRLESAFTSQMKLLDDAGHELRTPITIVRGNLELMDVNDPEDAIQVRDLATAELDRMARITDDLVMLAKTDRPDFIQATPTDVGPLLDHIYDLVSKVGDRRWQIDNRVEGTALLDSQRVTQAVIQLAANAVKFSEDGSRVSIGTAWKGTTFQLWCADEGEGISPEAMDVVFERFGRAPAAHAREGAGLGLAIVAAIAAGHGGWIDTKSALGVGTTFTLNFPDQSREASNPDSAVQAAESRRD